MKNPSTQVGGTHYNKMKIQPVTFIVENELSYCQGNVIKYVCRYADKNGVQDLKKAKQYIDFMIRDLQTKDILESVPPKFNDYPFNEGDTYFVVVGGVVVESVWDDVSEEDYDPIQYSYYRTYADACNSLEQ